MQEQTICGELGMLNNLFKRTWRANRARNSAR